MGNGKKPLLARRDIQAKIAQYLEMGAKEETIINALGIEPSTWERWKTQGATDRQAGRRASLYARFYIMLSSHAALSTVKVLGDLHKMSTEGNDKAAIALLRLDPAYRDTQQIHIHHTVEQLQGLTIEQLQRLIAGDTSVLQLLGGTVEGTARRID